MRNIHPNLAPILTFSGNAITGELFVFRAADPVDMEFSLPSHLIIFLPDEISGLCEWNAGHHIEAFWSLAANTVSFIPATKYLHFKVTKPQHPWRMLLLTIEPAVLARLGEDDLEQANDELCTELNVDDPAARQAMRALLQEIESQGDTSGLYVDTFLTLTLIHLLEYQLKHTKRPSDGYVRGGLATWRLKRALQFIESDTGKMPSLSEIANAVHLHQASFCRSFKQSTGLSPHHYLLVHRVNRAKEMMNDPDRSLTDIAFACGFSSSSQFSVVFKRIVGSTPQKFRSSL